MRVYVVLTTAETKKLFEDCTIKGEFLCCSAYREDDGTINIQDCRQVAMPDLLHKDYTVPHDKEFNIVEMEITYSEFVKKDTYSPDTFAGVMNTLSSTYICTSYPVTRDKDTAISEKGVRFKI